MTQANVFRVEKTHDYTVMSNFHLKDRNLSLKAKGLLSFMLSLPDDWDYSMNGLCSICKEQITSIRTTLKELQRCGYLSIKQKKNEKGLFEYEYIIREKPDLESPDLESPYIENPYMENHIQINTNKQNTNKQNTKELITNRENEKIKKNRFIKPTIQEIEDRCNEMGYSIDAESFFNYYESKGWVVGKSPMKNWQAALAGWNSRNNKGKSTVKGQHNAESLVGFKLWEKVMGIPQIETRENIDSVTRLIKEYGQKQVLMLILSARECKKDRRADFRASHIANYSDLEKNLEYLMDWMRQKNLQLNTDESIDSFKNSY